MTMTRLKKMRKKQSSLHQRNQLSTEVRILTSLIGVKLILQKNRSLELIKTQKLRMKTKKMRRLNRQRRKIHRHKV